MVYFNSPPYERLPTTGDDLDGARELVHEFDGLFGTGNTVFVTYVEVVGELFADGQYLFGRVEFAGLGIAAALAGNAQIVHQSEPVVDLSGKQRTCCCGKCGIVAVAAAAGAVEDEPREFVLFAHRFLGNKGHARIGELPRTSTPAPTGERRRSARMFRLGLFNGPTKETVPLVMSRS